MPYKRKSASSRKHKDVIPPVMYRDFTWQRDIMVPANVKGLAQYDFASSNSVQDDWTIGDSMPNVGQSFVTSTGVAAADDGYRKVNLYAPTYLTFSANCIADICPNIPFNCIDNEENVSTGEVDSEGNIIYTSNDNLNFKLTKQADDSKLRNNGVMETLSARKQVPEGWSDAGQHYRKYKVVKSSISVDLVPCPLFNTGGEFSGSMATSNVALASEDSNVTSVVSLHQQMFRMPGDLYKDPVNNTDRPARQVHLKRIITAGTRKTECPKFKLNSTGDAVESEITKDSEEYDALSLYSYLPWLDSSFRFHKRWPKTKMYVIPAYADKIYPGSYPGRKHMFHASWSLPGIKDPEVRKEYDAYLRPSKLINGITADGSLTKEQVDSVHPADETSLSSHQAAAIDSDFNDGGINTTLWKKADDADHSTDGHRLCPQREHVYVLRIGGQDVIYPTVADTIRQQSNHSTHCFKVTLKYKVMFFDKIENLQNMKELQDTTRTFAPLGTSAGSASTYGTTVEGDTLQTVQTTYSLKRPKLISSHQ